MSTIAVPTSTPVRPADRVLPTQAGPSALRTVLTLARRRAALSVRTPRELVVPLMTPILFAIVIAPALDSIGPHVPGIDYMTFAAIGTAGLLIPINCMSAGIGVLVDRESGARRDLLAAPIARPLIVLANLLVALGITALQVTALLIAAVLRGADLHVSATGAAWFLGAALLLAVTMYSVAETLANKIPSLEEFVGVLPAVAIVPYFFAGSLFPVSALPWAVQGISRVLPLTHALALLRYGLLGGNTSGLHDIWGMSNPTAMAALSLALLAVFAAATTRLAVRTFTKTAVV
jgi:ABC-type multidrug transport system permease subunit